MPDIKGVWCNIGSSAAAGGAPFIIVSLKQRYHGHAQQAGLAALASRGGNYHGRFVIVVDDDIDIYNPNDVIWAIGTRSEPEHIDILRRCWSGPLDPAIPRERKGFSSRMIIDASRPYEWRDQFPPAAAISPERQQAVMAKWKKELFS